mmetsp:Transcript_23686/g.66895  ORF Transcript_23686/g.66895 Transcript_23686/m.66895 type:complete len:358 (-) Transcript_23686:2099-3172(-)
MQPSPRPFIHRPERRKHAAQVPNQTFAVGIGIFTRGLGNPIEPVQRVVQMRVDLVAANFVHETVHSTDLVVARLVGTFQRRLGVLERLLQLIRSDHPDMAHAPHQRTEQSRQTTLQCSDVGHHLHGLLNGSFVDRVVFVLHPNGSHVDAFFDAVEDVACGAAALLLSKNLAQLLLAQSECRACDCSGMDGTQHERHGLRVRVELVRCLGTGRASETCMGTTEVAHAFIASHWLLEILESEGKSDFFRIRNVGAILSRRVPVIGDQRLLAVLRDDGSGGLELLILCHLQCRHQDVNVHGKEVLVTAPRGGTWVRNLQSSSEGGHEAGCSDELSQVTADGTLPHQIAEFRDERTLVSFG